VLQLSAIEKWEGEVRRGLQEGNPGKGGGRPQGLID